MRKALKWVGIVTIAFFIFVILMNLFSDDVKNSKPPAYLTEKTVSTTTEPIVKKAEYRLIGRLDKPNIENIFFVVDNINIDRQSVEKLVREIEDKDCKMQCNVLLYDDEKAAKLDMEYSQLTTSDAMSAWKEKNYDFVKVHNVGQLLMGDFTYYPLKK